MMLSLHLTLLSIFGFSLQLSVQNVSEDVKKTIQLKHGIAEGTAVQHPANASLTYTAYYGIPYAQPPVGDLRLRPPQRPAPPTAPATHVLTSSALRPACPQYPQTPGRSFSEDCLYINVFVPNGIPKASDCAKNNKKKYLQKVVVFHYGGAFIVGDASDYGPSDLVTKYDLIVVTFDYRVGPLGFFSTGNGDGNYGLQDQLMALQWVKENILDFGGDPDDVTAMGESAGSISISLLALSEKAKGLFSKAILQSIVATSPGCLQMNPLKQAITFAKILLCPLDYTNIDATSSMSKDQQDILMKCLRQRQGDHLTYASLGIPGGFYTMRSFADTLTSGVGFLPVVDGALVEREPARLLADPAHLRRAGALDRRYVIGSNNNEALIFVDVLLRTDVGPDSVTKTATTFKGLKGLFDAFYPKASENAKAKMLEKASEKYLKGYENEDKVPAENNLAIMNDAWSFVPNSEFALKLLQADPTVPIFMYYFDYNPKLRNASQPWKGSSHSMQLVYLFDYRPWATSYNFYTEVPAADDSDAALHDVFQGGLASFAKAGRPAGWPRYTSTSKRYFDINADKQGPKPGFKSDSVKFWTETLKALE